jgi:hypothetical protein
MKRKFRLAAAVLISAIAVAVSLHKARAALFGTVINGEFASSQVLPINLGAGVSNLGVTATYSSPTFSAATFTTGQVSTGSLTVASNSLLTAAAGTDQITVVSTSGAVGDSISLSNPIQPGAVVVREGRDWLYGATTSASATSLAAALSARSAQLGGVQFAATGNVVYATAPVGALYNNIHIAANGSSTLSLAHATITGGRDAAVVSVNGVPFKANRDFSVGVSSLATSSNLASAINTKLGGLVAASASHGVVSLQSVAAGRSFPLATSNSSAVSVSGASMIGAVAPSWAINGASIKVPSHGWVTALPVLYTQGASPAISGLTDQTTYYVGVVDANDAALATTAARAVAGQFVALASSSSLTAAASYSLSPLAFSVGSAGFDWEVSNDAQNWTALQVASVTYSSPGYATWSFGALPFRYLGLNLVAPSAGALSIQVESRGQ